MKITLENPSRIVLKDHNYTFFFLGIFFAIIGTSVAYSFFNNDLVGAAIGGVFAIVGVYIIATQKMITITLDKATNKGIISLRGLIGSGVKEMNLNEVKKVSLRKVISTTSSKDNSTSYEYIIGFVMSAGEELSFELATISASITDVLTSPDEKHKNEAKQIADFLRVPFEFTYPPSMGEMLSVMKQGITEGVERAAKKQI